MMPRLRGRPVASLIVEDAVLCSWLRYSTPEIEAFVSMHQNVTQYTSDLPSSRQRAIGGDCVLCNGHSLLGGSVWAAQSGGGCFASLFALRLTLLFGPSTADQLLYSCPNVVITTVPNGLAEPQ